MPHRCTLSAAPATRYRRDQGLRQARQTWVAAPVIDSSELTLPKTTKANWDKGGYKVLYDARSQEASRIQEQAVSRLQTPAEEDRFSSAQPPRIRWKWAPARSSWPQNKIFDDGAAPGVTTSTALQQPQPASTNPTAGPGLRTGSATEGHRLANWLQEPAGA
jgi:hypothetical protein